MPRIELLHQNTPEWHCWRMQGIRASDAPVIMGETPFKTARTLWSMKTGRMQEEPAGPAARRGRELERFVCRAYERQTGTQMEPLCLVHQEFEWMSASLDGLSFDGSTLLEIKCPLSLRDRASAQQGRIPYQYHAQLPHQLEVSGAERALRQKSWGNPCHQTCLTLEKYIRAGYIALLKSVQLPAFKVGSDWRFKLEEIDRRWRERERKPKGKLANPHWLLYIQEVSPLMQRYDGGRTKSVRGDRDV